MANQSEIATRVVESILAQKLAPGERLGEQELAEHFGVSRTLVREALMQLQARGFVEVRPRKGWYVVEPSMEEAKDAFAARRIVETGILRDAGRPLQAALRKLKRHVDDERKAIDEPNPAVRAFLLADFHVCLAETLGQRILADVMRDLTARTTLAASVYQSQQDARASCAQHREIVAALERGDVKLAEKLMLAHLGDVQDSLQGTAESSTRARLKETFAPVVLGRT